MDELIKRVLAVRSRLAPVNRTSLIVNLGAFERDVFAVALHCQLLKVGWESLQVLFVRQYRHRFCTKEIAVPDSQKAHQDWQVALERSCAEVLVHLVKYIQQRAEVFRAYGEHSREANRRVHGVAASDPIPKLKHVGCIDSELRH